jgi:carboxylate-amine ligase
MLLWPSTLDLAPESDGVLASLADDAYQPELRAAQIEIVGEVCRNAGELCANLCAARRRLIAVTSGSLRILACGTHPFSTDWGELAAGQRYQRLADEYEWAARRSFVCGLHVHVAIGGAARTLAVYNALRSYLPEIAALAANSPFFEGEDTGLCSIRPKLNQSLPRTGIPPPFGSWSEYVAFIDWGRQGGLFPDGTFFWWDMRPHPRYGTIEIRVADSQTRVEDAAGIAALVQSLAAWLGDRHDRGEVLPVHDTTRIAENSWRAMRYGVNGHLVDLDTGESEPTRERLGRLADDVEDAAQRLGSEYELVALRALLAGNGADRQRYVAERDGMRGLVEWLAAETELEPSRITPTAG